MSGRRVRPLEIERFRGDLFPGGSINFLLALLNDSNRFLTDAARSSTIEHHFRHSRDIIDRSLRQSAILLYSVISKIYVTRFTYAIPCFANIKKYKLNTDIYSILLNIIINPLLRILCTCNVAHYNISIVYIFVSLNFSECLNVHVLIISDFLTVYHRIAANQPNNLHSYDPANNLTINKRII